MQRIIKLLFIVFIFSILSYTFVEARAGGGGSSSSGGGDAIGLIVAGIIYAIYEIRRRKMIKKAKADLEKALAGDSSWNLKELEKATTNIFMKYQRAWSNKDLDYVREYMTKSYYEKAQKILNKSLNLNDNFIDSFRYKNINGKKNILENIKINNLTLMSVRDFPGRDGDMFAMEIDANMIDYTIDEKTGNFVESTLTKGKNESQKDYEKRAKREGEDFKEYYIFIRHNGKWLLNNIKQKFSIVGDIIKLKEAELIKILAKEKSTEEVNDDIFYTKGD